MAKSATIGNFPSRMALRLSFGTEPNLPISPLAPAFQLCRHRHHRRSGLSRRRRRRHLVISSLVVSCVTRAPGFSLPYYILTANTAQASVDCPRLYFLTATRRYVGFISLFFYPSSSLCFYCASTCIGTPHGLWPSRIDVCTTTYK